MSETCPNPSPSAVTPLRMDMLVLMCQLGHTGAREIAQHLISCEKDPCDTCLRYLNGIARIEAGLPLFGGQ